MKVLFLDIDGVLNTFKSGEFSKSACNSLNHILNSVPDLNIVISSSWRAIGLENVKKILKENGIDVDKVIDSTGTEPGIRGNQIQAWMNKRQDVDNFVILDDHNDMGNLLDKLVKVNSFIGLTMSDANRAIEILTR